MPEFIEIRLKRAAIALADKLDYARAAEDLNLTVEELQKQIAALEALLCLQLFKRVEGSVEVTRDGMFLIRAFREVRATHAPEVGESSHKSDQVPS